MRRWRMLLPIGLVLTAAVVGLVARRPAYPPSAADVFRTIIARVDTDHDGRISLAEWKHYGGSPTLFEAYDFNGDGYLDEPEFATMFYSTDPKPR